MLGRGCRDEQHQSSGVYGEVQVDASVGGAREREGQLHGLVLFGLVLLAVGEGGGGGGGGHAVGSWRSLVRVAGGWRVSGELWCGIGSEARVFGGEDGRRVGCAMIDAGKDGTAASARASSASNPLTDPTNPPRVTLHRATA